MAKTHLDQIVDYPAKIITEIASSNECVGLLLDKSPSDVTENDFDLVLEGDRCIFDYLYVDDTTQKNKAYIMVEIEVPSVENQTIKNVEAYITVSCHKSYMKLDEKKYPSIIGNRRDNLVRYIDKILNNKNIMGIGLLKLQSVRTITSPSKFTTREIVYAIPDFNVLDIE